MVKKRNPNGKITSASFDRQKISRDKGEACKDIKSQWYQNYPIHGTKCSLIDESTRSFERRHLVRA